MPKRKTKAEQEAFPEMGKKELGDKILKEFQRARWGTNFALFSHLFVAMQELAPNHADKVKLKDLRKIMYEMIEFGNRVNTVLEAISIGLQSPKTRKNARTKENKSIPPRRKK